MTETWQLVELTRRFASVPAQKSVVVRAVKLARLRRMSGELQSQDFEHALFEERQERRVRL